jgi:biofilm PGA synthesis N-glycosyltransferase PgaC
VSATAPRLLVVSPVRNEAAHIELVVRAIAAQRQPPTKWIVIDDRSTDDTLRLLRRLESEVSFMEVHEAGSESAGGFTRDRLARAAAPRNFNRGLAKADWRDYDYVMKLDGDIELAPGYLQTALERMSADPSIGLAGGYLDEPQPDGGFRRIPIPPHHVHGALKLYRRECFATIDGVQERLAWDTIDETYARMYGYRTISFPDLVSVHHRPWGTADGAIRGRTRLGQCAYITHYPPLWVLLRSLKLALERPRGVLGAAYLYGYARAVVTRTERVQDPRYRRFARHELNRRMAREAIPPRLRQAATLPRVRTLLSR